MTSDKALKNSFESSTFPKPAISSDLYRKMANSIRALSMDAVEKAKSGHPGMPMGMADVATILFSEFLKFDPKNPSWPDRDRFVLSAGHGSMLLYSLLYLTGYEDITIEEIKNFRQMGAKTAGHPEFGHAAGIETTTGPLGQGLANAVGMALAEKIIAARYGREIADHYTYAIAGDGCLMEGISQEAISFAGHLKLNKLIVLWDDNKISIDGPTDLSTSEDQEMRFKASGWNVFKIDGHNYDEIRNAIAIAKRSDRPTMIACDTTIGFGAPTKAGTSGSHGSPLGDKEIAGARKNLAWEHEAFHVPTDVFDEWRKIGKKHAEDFGKWHQRLSNLDHKKHEEYTRILAEELPQNFQEKILEFKRQLSEKQPKEATRQSSGNALELLTSLVPELIGGSADLTGSNNTKTGHSKAITRNDFSGNYIYYGVREHGMAAIMNGLALHGGIIPYGGTFLVFTDYCRPSIRLSALMNQRVIYVMTHDSIGLGEDGPTHQPVEHLSALRVIPNLNVLRPADSVETLESWQIALESKDRPSLLVLTRQALPTFRKEFEKENLTAKGGYIISAAKEKATISIIATGSEVEIAIEAQKKLAAKEIYADVVSMPCTLLFDEQGDSYRKHILPPENLKVAVEAASQWGWEKYIGQEGIFIGMKSFGLSAPYQELYKHFGITSDEIVNQITKRLK